MEKENVMIVRLTTGEELICEAVESKDGWLVNKPLLLVPVSLQNLSLVPWLAYAEFPEAGMFIPDKIIAFVAKPQKRLRGEYEKAFSKIIAPSEEIVSGAGMEDIANKLRLST